MAVIFILELRMEDTRYLLKLYLKSKLKAGRMYHDHIEATGDSQVFLTIRPVIEELEKRYLRSEPSIPDFAELIDYPDYIILLLDDITDDKIQWGRICAIFALAGLMFDDCIKSRQMEHFEKIIDFITWYMQSRQIENWIISQGGWSAVKFGNEDQEATDSQRWVTTLLSFAKNVMSLWQYFSINKL